MKKYQKIILSDINLMDKSSVFLSAGRTIPYTIPAVEDLSCLRVEGNLANFSALVMESL